MKYIAYGSNMCSEQMAYRCPDAKLIGTGKLYGAQLEFYTHATVEHTASDEAYVPVAVWDISKADELRLDRYEGVPSYYIKQRRKVHMDDGSTLMGMIYLMHMKRGGAPAAGYYNGIALAYKRLHLRSEIKTVLVPALERSLAVSPKHRA